MNIVCCKVECCLHQPQGTATEHQSLEIQARHEHRRTPIHSPQHVFLGHFNVLKDELAGVGAPHAHLV